MGVTIHRLMRGNSLPLDVYHHITSVGGMKGDNLKNLYAADGEQRRYFIFDGSTEYSFLGRVDNDIYDQISQAL